MKCQFPSDIWDSFNNEINYRGWKIFRLLLFIRRKQTRYWSEEYNVEKHPSRSDILQKKQELRLFCFAQ